MKALNLSKQQALTANSKAIQQINYIGNLNQAGKKQYFSLLKNQKKSFQVCNKEP